jgi:hypothetical protein
MFSVVGLKRVESGGLCCWGAGSTSKDPTMLTLEMSLLWNSGKSCGFFGVMGPQN